ncbi:PilX N-terminal domain-containing pilus assembly protein [Flagellatimonas centrodinii]|uniref:PilX N-terminal domain-containing pilus assembly protein n=1 Tax=Flagellatimonas centrodinii TaxID=2806210 RepID=UPI001FF061E1|nr:PilX N-terminal domain-containing pilus assembly protein [Flagellatimonas centrodinii]ULQ46808.1 PilX N-terminal domain-containing pilus assembly protein [Flagellatimonas centrodinii]
MSLPLSDRQHGMALVISLILLTVLTLIAVIAVRGSGLEAQLASNTVMRAESFSVSESTRRNLGEIIDVHTFTRGWPVSLNGTVPNDEFAFTLPPGLRLCAESSASDACATAVAADPPRAWYLGNSEAVTGFDPAVLDFDAEQVTDASQPLPQRARISVFKLVTDLNPGAGAAMVAGYEGVGKSAAAGGGRVFYYASSTGQDLSDTPQSETETGADYRHVIRN